MITDISRYYGIEYIAAQQYSLKGTLREFIKICLDVCLISGKQERLVHKSGKLLHCTYSNSTDATMKHML